MINSITRKRGMSDYTMTSEEEIASLKQKIQEQAEIIDYLTKKLFGQKTEKIDGNQTSLFDEDDGVFTQPEQTGQENQSNQVQSTKKTKRTRQAVIGSNVPVQETVIDLPDKQCPNGHGLVSVGKKFVREELHFRPVKLYLEKIYTMTYKCPSCESIDGLAHLIQSQAPNALMPHSLASVSVIAEILHKKFELGVPLYRQLQDWKRLGVDLSETTIPNWVIKVSQIMVPLYQQLRQQLVQQPCLQGDETPIEVLREPGKAAKAESYMWVMRSVTHQANRGVYYAYNTSRASIFAKTLYAGFTGTLQCDGYSGYNILDESVTRVGCWAHVRRKFYDAGNSGKEFKMSTPLALLNKMFHNEREWQHLSPRARRRRRRSQQKKLLKRFWGWIDVVNVLPKSRLGKAVTYARNQRVTLNRIINNGAVDWSNNASERNMKTLVIGRKNWLFSTSQAGTRANAIWMTLIELAKANGIDPSVYLVYLLKNIPQLPIFANSADLEVYLPWNFKQKLKVIGNTKQSVVA